MLTDTVSVIMPVYNCAELAAEAVGSVAAQTYKNWELIIVDDCSDDGTYESLQKLTDDKRIRCFQTEKRGGPAAARNLGLDKATGDYIAFIDGDDLWEPRKLEVQLDFVKKTGAKLSCTAYGLMDESGNRKNGAVRPPRVSDYRKILMRGNTIGNSTAMYSRADFANVRIPDIKKRNDFALWLELTRGGESFYGIDETLAWYRIRKKSVSSNKLKLIRYHWQLYRKIERLSVPASVAALISLLFYKSIKKLKNLINRIGL